MATFILIRNKTDSDMWDICTKSKTRIHVWATIHDDALYDAGEKEERICGKFLMDFTLTEAPGE